VQRRERRNHIGVAWPVLFHPGIARPGRGSAMFDQEIVFTTGRAAFFALNGIVVLLIAVYVAARWR